MRCHPIRCACLFSLALAIFISLPAVSAVHEYMEDFTTKDYCDTLNTTAEWDTLAGEIRLPPFEVTLAGSYNTPGSAYAVAVAGDHAYVANGNYGLQVLDISDPTSPVLAGSYDASISAQGIAIAGDHAYVAASYYGLLVLDVSDPTTPVLAGSYNTPGSAYGVAVAGDHAYVADDGSGGLQVLDISDPTAPTLAGSYDTPGDARGVAIAGDRAYVADYGSGLQVLDISDPTAPVLAGSYDTPGNARSVAIAGDHAYVADDSAGGLQVLDISDPTAPVLAGSYDTPGWARGVAIAGDRAYVADYFSGLVVLDVSDPTAPTLAGSYDTPGYASGIAIAGDRAYVADYGSGLQVLNISAPMAPALAGSYNTPGSAYAVAVAGDHAYVADWESGLVVLDISEPTAPVLAGSYDTPGNARDVAIAGDHAYVADWESGLVVVDISDPTAPTLAGSYDVPGNAGNVAIAGDHAYVADETGVQVLDISDPMAPTFAGSYDALGVASDVAIAGDHAYVAHGSQGLQVLDISDPTAPTLAGSYDTPHFAEGIAIAGDHAYVADHTSGLQVLDISDPTAPVLAGSYDTPGWALAVAVAGDHAYVADLESGLQVLDISDPTAPVLVGSYDGVAGRVAIAGDYAYVGAGNSGLQVVQVRQRTLLLDANIAQSMDIEPYDGQIARARLNSSQTDSIAWELSADGGSTWGAVVPGGAGHEFTSPGSDLRWRSSHFYAARHVNPTCTDLVIDWFQQSAEVDLIADTPDDQGGWVRLFFTRSGYDFSDSGTPIASYYVWSRIDEALAARVLSEGELLSLGKPGRDLALRAAVPVAPPAMEGQELYVYDGGLYAVPGPGRSDGFPTGTWEVVGSAPAVQQDGYAVRIPTVGDSTASGVEWTVLFVTAHTTTPSIWYASFPDSGYSVDNIAPAVPGGFAVDYLTGGGNALAWDTCPDEDFQYFRVYRGDSEDLEPSPETLVHVTIDVSWLDPDGTGWNHYKIAAVDHAGNESDAATPESITGVDEPETPERFALQRNVPNPFRFGTVIAYDVPAEGGEVELVIYDVAGRLVRTLVDGFEMPGTRSVSWDGQDDGGRAVGSGVYYCRLEAPGFEQSIKITVLR